MKIDIEQIKVLLQMVGEADIAELTIEMEEERITIKKPSGMMAPVHQPVHHEFVAVSHNDADANKTLPAGSAHATSSGHLPHHDKNNAEKEEHLVAVTAPMVGTFYRSSSPTTAPFVETGDKIAVGQTICIIEAMKLMNDLPAEISGKVVKICAENGATVEFGQQLFLVDPRA